MNTLPVIFGRVNKIGSLAIRLWTWSTWSHIGVITECGNYVIESVGFKGVIVTPINEFKSRYTTWVIGEVPITNTRTKAYTILNSYIGSSYDYLAIMGRIFRRRWDKKDAFVCSELFAIASGMYRDDRIARVDPEHIWMITRTLNSHKR